MHRHRSSELSDLQTSCVRMHARFRDPTVLQMGRPTHLPARGPVSVWCMTGGVSVSEKRCTPARARVPTDTTKTGSSYESHAASPTLTAHQPYSVAPTPGPLLQIPFFSPPARDFQNPPQRFRNSDLLHYRFRPNRDPTRFTQIYLRLNTRTQSIHGVSPYAPYAPYACMRVSASPFRHRMHP